MAQAKVSGSLEHWQYWNRIFSRAYPCGQDFKEEEKVTVGAKQQLIAEVGGKLGVGVNGVSAELSSKLQTAISIYEEKQTTYTIQKMAPQCLYLRLTSWQLVDEYAIHEDAVLFGMIHWTPKSVTLSSRAAVYHDDHFLWAHPDCCDNARVSKGQRYVLDYPNGRLVLPERPTGLEPKEEAEREQDEGDTGTIEGRRDENAEPDASISLFSVAGKWHIKDRVPASALASDIAALVSPQKNAEARITMLRALDEVTIDRSQAISATSTRSFDSLQTYFKLLQHEGSYAMIGFVAGVLLVIAGALFSILGLTGSVNWLGALTGVWSRLANAAPGAGAVVVGIVLIVATWLGMRMTAPGPHIDA